jgi:MinD-like ATPase involved in chromosome partitioning or flagellar assembly
MKAPEQLESLRHWAAERRTDSRPADGGRVLAVGSAAGGSGTSTIAALLAATTAQAGARVLLIDASDRFGGLDPLLGADIAGLEVASLAPSSPAHSLSPSERRLALRRILGDATFDLAVIDAGATAASLTSVATDGAHLFLAVMRAERIAVTATYALVKLLSSRAPTLPIALLVNHADAWAGQAAATAVRTATERFLNRSLGAVGAVPDDAHLAQAVAAGFGLSEVASGSSAGHALRDIANLVCTAERPFERDLHAPVENTHASR